MNPNQPGYQERERAELFRHLATAETALRAILHVHTLTPEFRAHAERAVAHVREGRVVLTAPESARTVEGLDQHLERTKRFLANLPTRSGGSQRP